MRKYILYNTITKFAISTKGLTQGEANTLNEGLKAAGSHCIWLTEK